MNILIRKDWRTVQLVGKLTLGECVVSSQFPQLALQITPTVEQAENAFVLANFLYKVVESAFGKPFIHSWIRDFNLNYAVGGVTNSGHLLGSSMDFSCPDATETPEEIFNFLLKDLDWPGELFLHRKTNGLHADLPRLGVWMDRKILDK